MRRLLLVTALLGGCATGVDSPFAGTPLGTGGTGADGGSGDGGSGGSGASDGGGGNGGSDAGPDGGPGETSNGGTDGGGTTNGSAGTSAGCVPEPEVCDGVDNDCNDQIDEGFDVGGTCMTGMPGICADGVNACTAMGTVECQPNNTPGTEMCNGVDDDCDGVTDNGNPGGGVDCDTGDPGVCAAGTTDCSSGTVECVANTAASAEACNGLDDDCDGAVDNGIPGVGGSCSTGMPGICAAGTEVCDTMGMSLVCQQNQSAGTETCNNLDDNCNGVVDDGIAGTGTACSTGLPGVCAAGTNVCDGASSSIVCQQNTAASGEVCGDGLDNNCDGATDEGCPCAHDLCTNSTPLASGCDPCVTTVCASDPFCCSTGWDGVCIGEVESLCSQADCIDPACAHLVCVTGVALDSTCHACAGSVCASDPFCCSNTWDTICVGEVGSICGLTCP